MDPRGSRERLGRRGGVGGFHAINEEAEKALAQAAPFHPLGSVIKRARSSQAFPPPPPIAQSPWQSSVRRGRAPFAPPLLSLFPRAASPQPPPHQSDPLPRPPLQCCPPGRPAGGPWSFRRGDSWGSLDHPAALRKDHSGCRGGGGRRWGAGGRAAGGQAGRGGILHITSSSPHSEGLLVAGGSAEEGREPEGRGPGTSGWWAASKISLSASPPAQQRRGGLHASAADSGRGVAVQGLNPTQKSQAATLVCPLDAPGRERVFPPVASQGRLQSSVLPAPPKTAQGSPPSFVSPGFIYSAALLNTPPPLFNARVKRRWRQPFGGGILMITF